MSAGKLTIREVAELSLFCALMVAGKECLRVIQNVHPVTLLLLLATIIYGVKALYPAFGFALLEIALYGAGIWNLMYLYVWPIAVLIALPFRSSRSRFRRSGCPVFGSHRSGYRSPGGRNRYHSLFDIADLSGFSALLHPGHR